MSTLKFAANLSSMFTEAGDLPARYMAAKAAGFKGVECAEPYGHNIDVLQAAREESGLSHVLINCESGDTSAGECGFAALPHKVKRFRESLEKSIEYAKALLCPRIHLRTGATSSVYSDSAMEEVYIDNLKYAAERLKEEGLIGMVEAVNSFVTVKNYYMDSPQKAYNVVKKLNHPNIRLQLDIYHLQMTQGNLKDSIEKYLPYTDHIQIAQAPDRNEPSAPGEINYDYVLSVLQDLKYDGWIGLEYFPSGTTEDSLKWMDKYC